MTAIPLVRAGTLQAIARWLARMDLVLERSLERARLTLRVLQESELLVPFASVAHVLEDAARLYGVDDLGLRIGADIQLAEIGAFGRLIAGGGSVWGGLQALYTNLHRFNSASDAWMVRRADQVELHHRFRGGDEAERRHYTATVVMMYLNFLATAAGAGWRPASVRIGLRALPGWQRLPMLATCRTEIGHPWTTITFSAALLARPLPRPPTPPNHHGTTGWQEQAPAADVGGAVGQVVGALLPDGYPDIRLVAELVRMSPRTLQRRLQVEGRTFEEVVAGARLEAARRLLADPNRKIIDVAFDLGYSDPAHFSRAFLRWTGLTPREFRRLLARPDVSQAS